MDPSLENSMPAIGSKPHLPCRYHFSCLQLFLSASFGGFYKLVAAKCGWFLFLSWNCSICLGSELFCFLKGSAVNNLELFNNCILPFDDSSI